MFRRTLYFFTGCLYVLGMSCVSYADKWPLETKSSYVTRCTSSMISQGLQKDKAGLLCNCVADGMEKQFSKAEYNQMMNANPDPNGNKYDQRLFKIMDSCGKKIQ